MEEERQSGILPSQLVSLQEMAESLRMLTQGEIESAWERREERVAAGRLLEDSDLKVLKELAAALKTLVSVVRDVYAIPTIKEGLDLEKWAEEQREQGGESGGVILLPQLLEREEAADGEDMGTPAEADGVSGTAGV